MDFKLHLAALSADAAMLLATPSASEQMVRRACHAALADQSVQGAARAELLALIQSAPDLWVRAPKARRTELVQIRLTPDEAELLKEFAQRAGVSVSQWARSRMLAGERLG
jgi:hypothetical protein